MTDGERVSRESQLIEWKEAWRDEYLKWICGFANAQGGVLEIGRNDRGDIVGVKNVFRLLEEIPNKALASLGIVVDVNLKTEAAREYLQVVVEPYPNPISYKGEFHYRIGSTKQVLRGAALSRFLLQKYGRTWDDVPLPGWAPVTWTVARWMSSAAAPSLAGVWPTTFSTIPTPT